MNSLIKRFLLSGFLSGCAVVPSVHAQTMLAALEPVRLVRSLQSLQDDIAIGQPGAQQMQAHVLNNIGNKLIALDPSVWENADNLYAVITYLFNGGNPQVVETILKQRPEGVISDNLVKGTLAYMHHKKGAFMKAFASPPPENADIPAALILSIYLSTVVDLSEEDPALAMDRLDRVRLMAPGSLFEEAAIRRQVKVATMVGDIPKIKLLTRNYTTRFSKSPYASEFWREFIETLPRIDRNLNDDQLIQLIDYAPITIQYVVLLRVTRGALIDARMARAHFGAEKALNLAEELHHDTSQARFYYAASAVGSTAAGDAARILLSIDPAKLQAKDRPLLEAAQAVAHGVVLQPEDIPQEVAHSDAKVKSATSVESVGIPINQLEDGAEAIPANLPTPGKVTYNRGSMQKSSQEIDDYVKKTQQKVLEIDQLLGGKK